MNVQSAFDADDPERIYKSMKKYGLLTRKTWPGLGRMRVTAKISDEEAIEKFLDGRYITFSAGSTTDRHVCSVCLSDWATGDFCEHNHGQIYDNDICVFITGNFEVLEGSVVNMPADDLSQVHSMEMSDFVKTRDISSIKVDKHTVYLTDSMYSIKDRQTEPEKEYNRMLKLPEVAMQKPPSKERLDVAVKSGTEEIKIRPTRTQSEDSRNKLSTVEDALKAKVLKHNENHDEEKGKRISLTMLKAVWERGADAYLSDDAPDTSKGIWAMARVNIFIDLVEFNKPKNLNYTVDNDLLPAGHPKKNKGRE